MQITTAKKTSYIADFSNVSYSIQIKIIYIMCFIFLCRRVSSTSNCKKKKKTKIVLWQYEKKKKINYFFEFVRESACQISSVLLLFLFLFIISSLISKNSHTLMICSGAIHNDANKGKISTLTSLILYPFI